MWNTIVILVMCLCSFTYAVPLGLKKNMAIVQEEEDPMMMVAGDEETRPEVMISRLNLPSNATSIRADITDGFSCDNKTYGYYADVENECQIFHVCLPVTYADGKENTFRWSFICPEETVFSQESFTCMRPEDMSIDCEESFKYYELNRNFGVVESDEVQVSAEEDMVMEEMPKQPLAQDLIEDSKPSIFVGPVRKQTVKVQNSNRKKTQTNRVTADSLRRKPQPSRKTPQFAAPVTTAKPVEEDLPMLEPEVERTTIKYQRLTKRPITAVKEQPKPEQQAIRQELFTQKRKRPQIYSATRLDAAVQTESLSKPEAPLKLDATLPQQSSPVLEDQAEAQASEIAEVSIKPQMEKMDEPKRGEVLKSESIDLKEEQSTSADQPSEIAPMPANTPSVAEIVEIPIQKIDEPIFAAVPAISAPMPDQLKIDAEVMEPMKAEEEKLKNEELTAEKTMEAEMTKVLEAVEQLTAEKSEAPAEPEMPMEAEKVLFEPILEADKVPEANEPEKMVEAFKSDAKPEDLAPEAVRTAENILEAEMPEESASDSNISITEPEKPTEIADTPLRIESTVPEPDSGKISEEMMSLPVEPSAPASELEKQVPAAESEKPQNAKSEIEEPKSELNEQAEVPAPGPAMPLKTESSVVEIPLEAELPVSLPEMSMGVAEPVADPEQEIEVAPIELVDKPADSELPAEPMIDLKPQSQMPLEAEQSEASKSEGEAPDPIEQIASQVQANVEESSQSSAAETEDAQSLILDFISSLVNSQNSNLETKPIGSLKDVQTESLPEPPASEIKLDEETPAEVQAEEEQPKPMYIPMMQNNDAMYQIPVQVIEASDAEPLVPALEAAPPKLPMSIDDVVELVKESLDTAAEKENLMQNPSADQPPSQPDSDEVKPIYHRYFELGSNLLKSQPLTASDEEEPTVIAAANDNSMAQEEEQPTSNQLPKATEQLQESEQLASDTQALPAETSSPAATADKLPISRSLNRFHMDPRKRRFLFRSDAS